MNKLAALPIRRKASEEKQIYKKRCLYSPFDYEILLRMWPAEPHLNYLAAFSPVLEGSDPGSTLLQQFYQWSKQLAVLSGHSEEKGIIGLKSIFLSPVQTYDKLVQVEKADITDLQFLAFIIPTTNITSHVASIFPTDNTRFPQFYCFGQILRDMYSKTIDIHPATKEMLALLNIWLSQQHDVPHSLNQIFHPPPDKRSNTVTRNPLHYDRGDFRVSNDYHQIAEDYDNLPVDVHAVNPYYGTDIKINDKPDLQLVNQYFGMGEPDYYAIGTSPSKWNACAHSTDEDWTNIYPLHKAACENNVGAIRRWARRGRSADELDGDGWSPLHYACWYGELEAVQSLLDDCSAIIEIQNTPGDSTPLHFAAGKGWSGMVNYMLYERLANAGALDSEGRSPLAVCLECKENDWENTAKMLRQAYKEQTEMPYDIMSDMPPFDMIPHEDPVIASNESNDCTGIGSLPNILEEVQAAQVPQRKKRTSTITRININFMDGSSGLAVFQKGKGTPALDGLQEACSLVELGLEYQFVFALWIASKSLAIQLGDIDKPLKLMEKWPILMERFSANKNEIATIEMRRNVFFPAAKERNISDSKALEFLYHDAKYNVLKGYYSCDEREAIELATITMQLTHGDHNSVIHVAGYIMDKLLLFVPYYHVTKKSRMYLERQILTQHNALSQQGFSNVKLYQKYLELCRKWPFYAATFYEGQMIVTLKKSSSSRTRALQPPVKPGRRHTLVRIGINNLGFHIVNKTTNVYLQSYSLEDMIWDMSKKNNTFTLQNKSKTLKMVFQTKQAPLLDSLATEMDKELQIHKKMLENMTKITRVRTKS